MKRRIIGLGNPILTDDGVGIYAARRLRPLLEIIAPDVDVIEAEVGGFDLLELLVGFDDVVLVDAVQFDGVEPGTLLEIDPADLRTSLRLRSVHEIDLPTVMALGEKLGYAMPKSLKILAIQGKDLLTLGERLTPVVAAALPVVVDRVLALVCVPPCGSHLPLTAGGSDPTRISTSA